MIQGVGENAGFGEVRRAVMELVALVNASGTDASGSLGAVDTSGAETIRTAGGTVSVPAREKQTWIKALVTDRRMVGGGAVSGNISPGSSVEYKVTPLDTGLESDWIEPRRKFDTDTIGFIPAPVDDPEGTRSYAFVSRFPAGDGTYDLVLDVQEKLHGGTCVEAE